MRNIISYCIAIIVPACFGYGFSQLLMSIGLHHVLAGIVSFVLAIALLAKLEFLS